MKDMMRIRYTVCTGLAAIFFVSIFITAYLVYSLHFSMMRGLPGQTPGTIYLWLAIALVSGATCLWLAMNLQEAIVVYRERSADDTRPDQPGITPTVSLSLDAAMALAVKDPEDPALPEKILHLLCAQLEAVQGAVYVIEDPENREAVLKWGYALPADLSHRLEAGTGLAGQVAGTGNTLYLDNVPEGYLNVVSGLGSAPARYLLIVPLKNKRRVAGVMEIASFAPFNQEQIKHAEATACMLAEKALNPTPSYHS